MMRTLALGFTLAASTAAGALAVATAQAFILVNASSAYIDVPTHAAGLAVGALSFVAMLVGFLLAGVWPFADAAPAPIHRAEVKNITVAMKVDVDDSALDRTRAKAEGLRAVVESIAPHVSLLSGAPASTGRTVTLIRGDKGRFRSTNPNPKPRRRKSDRMAVAEGE